jgi:hypothetical protein
MLFVYNMCFKVQQRWRMSGCYSCVCVVSVDFKIAVSGPSRARTPRGNNSRGKQYVFADACVASASGVVPS